MLFYLKIAIPDKKRRLPLCHENTSRKLRRPIVLFLQSHKFHGKYCLMQDKNRMPVFCSKAGYVAHLCFLQVPVRHSADRSAGKIPSQPAAAAEKFVAAPALASLPCCWSVSMPSGRCPGPAFPPRKFPQRSPCPQGRRHPPIMSST